MKVMESGMDREEAKRLTFDIGVRIHRAFETELDKRNISGGVSPSLDAEIDEIVEHITVNLVASGEDG